MLCSLELITPMCIETTTGARDRSPGTGPLRSIRRDLRVWYRVAITSLALVTLTTVANAQTRNGGDPAPEVGQVAVASVPAGAGPDGAGPDRSEGVEPTEVPQTTGGAAPAGAGTAEQPPDVEELERRLDLLADEVERLRSGEDVEPVTIDEARRLGLAPSAASTYGRGQGVSIAGYGEMLLENFGDENEAGNPTGKTTQFDFLRAIIYAGYRFNDKFLFNSEIEVEHADEIFVEFAYLDYRATDNLGFRGGVLLVPMGLVNEFHEPTVFLGAERPVTESLIIPSTWRENGGGIYGGFDRVSFRAYVMNGFDGLNFSENGVRGGRQKASRTKATSMAFTGRVDVTPTPGVFVGASVYTGDSGQGQVVVDGTEYGVRTTIFDLHGQMQVRGLDVRGLFARAHLDDAAQLNQLLDTSVGDRMQGAYIQVGYDLLSQTNSAGVALTPYVRYEQVDTQDRLPEGLSRSLSTDNTYVTAGIELKPISNIVVKVDHAWVTNDAETGVNQFNVLMGYAF